MRRPRSSTLFPYTTLFRSRAVASHGHAVGGASVSAATPHARSGATATRSEEHTSELQSLRHLVCRLLLEKKNVRDEKAASLLVHLAGEYMAREAERETVIT